MNVRVWVTAIMLIIINGMIWVAFAPAFKGTSDKLEENLIDKMAEGKAKQVGEKIINAGANMYTLLIVVFDITILIWAFLTGQKKEVLTGVYRR